MRQQQGVSQGELVKRTGLQASYLSKVENGVVLPGLGNLERIARAMRISLADLLAPRSVRDTRRGRRGRRQTKKPAVQV